MLNYNLIKNFIYNRFMKKLFVANWKMNPLIIKEAKRIVKLVLYRFFLNNTKLKIIVCPPFVWLKTLIDFSKNKINFGAQNTFYEDQGAFTGEISPKMLKNIGVKYVILGHSERRKYLNETDNLIALKINSVLKNRLIPILCIGEDYNVRRKGINVAKKFIFDQIKKDFKYIILNKNFLNKEIIIAYEPIWAISTSEFAVPDDPESAEEIITFIKEKVKNIGFKAVKVLYGGSVNSENILNFLSRKEIDGVLVGGASIKISELKKIIKTLKEYF